MKRNFSRTYNTLRISRLASELEMLPKVTIGNHHGQSVVRCYSVDEAGRRKYRTVLPNSDEGSELLRSIDRRDAIEKQIVIIKQLINDEIELERKLVSSVRIGADSEYRISEASPLNEEFWKNLGSDENGIPKAGQYIHGSTKMRSRAEVLVAEILDSLGLEYKYEPAVRFGNKVYYPDFVVYVPEIRRCIIIELFGMIDKVKYNYDMFEKLEVYSQNNLLMDRDYIGIFGTQNMLESSEYIHNKIVWAINIAADAAVGIRLR